jgi:hypothetical protein
MSVPIGLDLYKWWAKAQCKGKPVESLTRDDCWGCPVQRECLWVAITDDDRLADQALFIRGGLPASKRDDLWLWSKRDDLKTYVACLMEADRSEFASKRRRKGKANQ